MQRRWRLLVPFDGHDETCHLYTAQTDRPDPGGAARYTELSPGQQRVLDRARAANRRGLEIAPELQE
jgi:hypothetical protein